MKRVKHYQTVLEFCGFFPFDFRGLCENWLIKHAHNGFQIETRLHFKSSFQHFIYSGYVCCWVVDALQVAYWWFQYYFTSSCTYFIASTGWYVLIFVKFSTHYPTNIELFLVSHQEISLRTIEQSKFFWSNSASTAVVLNLSNSWWVEKFSSTLCENRSEKRSMLVDSQVSQVAQEYCWREVLFHALQSKDQTTYVRDHP